MTDKRCPPAHEAEQGFTLVELMIALVIIAIGVMALSGIQTTSSRNVYTTGRQTSGLSLAQEQIEVARSSGYATVAPDTGLSAPYSWITEVDSVDIELKRVRVTVTWPENTTTSSLQLETLIAAR